MFSDWSKGRLREAAGAEVCSESAEQQLHAAAAESTLQVQILRRYRVHNVSELKKKCTHIYKLNSFKQTTSFSIPFVNLGCAKRPRRCALVKSKNKAQMRRFMISIC